MPDAAARSGRTARGPVSPRSILGTLALLLAAILALFVADTVLARLDRAARRSEAAQLDRQGRALAAAGHHRQAVDRLRAALAIDRGNRDYELALARSLAGAGRAGDAESTLVGVLRRDATDGEANLALARVLVRQRRIPEATSYYHRAIYGRWSRNTPAHRRLARLELIELLAGADAKADLLAELLPLEGAGIADTGLRRRVAHLYVQAGSPERGAAIFRGLLEHSPRDADAYAGLGEAQFALRNYRAAAASLRRAARLQPGNQDIAHRLELVTRVLALDPMQRGLGSAERERRAAALLQIAVDEARRCAGAAPPDSVSAVIDSGTAALATAVQPAARDEAFESRLDLADRLRTLGDPACRGAGASEQALELVLAEMAD